MRFPKPAALTCAATAAALAAVTLVPSAAFAHGYVGDDGRDPSTTLQTRAAIKANANMGSIQYEPQSLEAPKGFPEAGPRDGQLASAGDSRALNLDEQSEDRWVKNEVTQGDVTVNWTFTAPHQTTQWRYYMTTDGWDPNDELERSDFELIETVTHDGSAASNNPSHTVTIPEDREGYHVIYAVWDVADTANAFYNVIDVDVEPREGGAPDPIDSEAPSAVPGAAVRATSSTEAELTWGAASDNEGVTGYQLLDMDETGDDQVIRTVAASERSATVSGLTPGSTHTFGVRATDKAGNVSATVAPLGVTMPEAAAAPTAPKHLHDMGTTESAATLMWTAGDATAEGIRYEIFRDGVEVGTTTKTMFVDTGLEAGTKYTYTVRAVDAAGVASALSNAHTATTKGEASPEAPAWDAKGAYVKGDVVSHEGVTYQAVQSYQGHGDPGWITALSLWAPIG